MCACVLCVLFSVSVWRAAAVCVLCACVLLFCVRVCCVRAVCAGVAGGTGCARVLCGALCSPVHPPPCSRLNQNKRLLSLWPLHAQYRSIFAGAYLHGPFVERRQNAVRGAYWLGNLTKNAVRVCGFRKIGYSGCVPEGSYLALFRETRKK